MMSETVVDITPSFVQTIFEAIGKPSQLCVPLDPAHLSTPLLQRHRFLGLHPSLDTTAYLTWPSEHNELVIQLLEDLELQPSTTLDIRYSGDVDSTYAHVGLARLRLVFVWEAGGWRFHNCSLTPFPEPVFRRLQDLANSLANEDNDPSTADDDGYWSNYGKDSVPQTPAKSAPVGQSEDDYWGQYASVEGTADSTNPSPLPVGMNARGQHSEPIVSIPRSTLQPSSTDPSRPPYAFDLADRLSLLISSESRMETMSPAPSQQVKISLKESVRGLFGLWTASSGTADDFLAVVKEVVNVEPEQF